MEELHLSMRRMGLRGLMVGGGEDREEGVGTKMRVLADK